MARQSIEQQTPHLIAKVGRFTHRWVVRYLSVTSTSNSSRHYLTSSFAIWVRVHSRITYYTSEGIKLPPLNVLLLTILVPSVLVRRENGGTVAFVRRPTPVRVESDQLTLILILKLTTSSAKKKSACTDGGLGTSPGSEPVRRKWW